MKYRVRKIWFGDYGARYDLNQLNGTQISDLASVAANQIMWTDHVDMTAVARKAIYTMVDYEIKAHCWGTKWNCRTAADIFVETIPDWSSSAMMAMKILEELTKVGFLRKEYNEESGLNYQIDYAFIAEKSKVELIPEAY